MFMILPYPEMSYERIHLITKRPKQQPSYMGIPCCFGYYFHVAVLTNAITSLTMYIVSKHLLHSYSRHKSAIGDAGVGGGKLTIERSRIY